jgi:tagatose-1,6-bisphosphate aldolase non-catalytic subunit AgaZ/GatZ
MQRILQEVAHARKQAERLSEEMRAAQEAYAATPEYARYMELKAQREEALVTQREAEDRAREAALAIYAQTGVKQVVPKVVTIAVRQGVLYDPQEVLAWARTYNQDLLTLDTKRFEDGVKDGVITSAPATVEAQPSVRLATDLSAFLHLPSEEERP